MKKLITTLALTTATSFAVVTANFNAPFSGGVTGNFANSAGDTFDGLLWGIIVDADGNGFDSLDGVTGFDPFSAPSGTGLTVAGGDVFIPGDLLTGMLAGGTEGDFTTVETQGSLLGGVTGISGDFADTPFSLAWFDEQDSATVEIVTGEPVVVNDGSVITTTTTTTTTTSLAFGTLEDDSFVLGPDGSTISYDAVFEGEDPIRTADDGTIVLDTVTEDDVETEAVPEPTSGMLLALSGLALITRRKR